MLQAHMRVRTLFFFRFVFLSRLFLFLFVCSVLLSSFVWLHVESFFFLRILVRSYVRSVVCSLVCSFIGSLVCLFVRVSVR